MLLFGVLTGFIDFFGVYDLGNENGKLAVCTQQTFIKCEH